MLKCSGSLILRLGSRGTLRKYSSLGATVKETEKIDTVRHSSQGLDDSKDRNNLVAAAFAALQSPETERKPSLKSVKPSKIQQLDSQIQKAMDVDSLLLVAENPVVSRKHALKMVSVLSEWSSNNKVKLEDFEKDPRFLKLCRILARTPTTQAMTSMTLAEDLSTVLGITGDDEAARLIANLTLPQMIKVMKALQSKGRRSTPLLRALSFNINKQSEVIDLKKAADLLFSMSSLNFPDPVLLDRICHDIVENLPANKDKPAVVTSIMVSFGLLRYRHESALTAVTHWLQDNADVVRASDIASSVVTLATVNFVPQDCDMIVDAAKTLSEDDLTKPQAWLDLVFALLILNRAEKHQLESTLQPEFIDKLLASGEISIPARRKLMAIDGYLSLHQAGGAGGAGGAALADDISVGVPAVHTKEKAMFVQSILDTFRSLVSAENFLKRNVNTNMGFVYDAEFAVDDKCHPVPLEKAADNKSIHRIAVLGLDYHDMTRKSAAPLGINQLYTRLLQLKGFQVLQIPYTEFNPRDKLITRVQYIEKKLKEIVSQSSKST